MFNFNSIMLGTANPEVLAEFYEKVFERPADWMEEKWYSWKVGDFYFNIGGHSEVKGEAKEPQRAILNFETETVKEGFERIKSIGAKVIKEPYEMEGTWIATLADSDGNYFQLMTPWKMD